MGEGGRREGGKKGRPHLSSKRKVIVGADYKRRLKEKLPDHQLVPAVTALQHSNSIQGRKGGREGGGKEKK